MDIILVEELKNGKQIKMEIRNCQLDLHGVKHKEVFSKVDSFIGEHILKGTYCVEIITGKSKEMKYLVKNVLSGYELFSEETLINPGKLIINLT